MSIEFVVGFYIGYIGLCSAVVWFAQLLRLRRTTRGRLELRLLPQMRKETMTPETYTCTHYGIDSGGADYYGTSNPPQEADWNYAYCPRCGEEL